MSEKCPKCGGDLYQGWHTNVPGADAGRDADEAICTMTKFLREELAELRERVARWQQRAKAAEAIVEKLPFRVYDGSRPCAMFAQKADRACYRIEMKRQFGQLNLRDTAEAAHKGATDGQEET